jgi:fructose-specific phosphotransferase system IIC component
MMIPSLIIVWIVCSLLIAVAGQKFRFGFWGYLFASLLLTPIIGLLLLAAAIPVRPKGATVTRERGNR